MIKRLFLAMALAVASISTVTPVLAWGDPVVRACVQAASAAMNAAVQDALADAIAGNISWSDYQAIYNEARADYLDALGECW